MSLKDLETELGYTFKNRDLLVEALTTPAYSRQHGTVSYENLEFLGDSVVKLIVANALHGSKYHDPEEKTKVRNVIESNKVLARQAADLGLHHHVISLTPISATDVGILSDIFEALAAAIYLDSGKDLDVVKLVLVRHIINKLDEYVESSSDYHKNMFIEAVQKIFGFTPLLRMDYKESGPDHDKKFECYDLRVMNPNDDRIVLAFPSISSGKNFKQKKDAEKQLLKMAFDDWRAKDFRID